jgi:hypothetical protein
MARRRRFRQWPQDQVSTECLNASSIATPTAGNSSLHKQRHREQEAFLTAGGHSQVLGGFGRQMRQL